MKLKKKALLVDDDDISLYIHKRLLKRINIIDQFDKANNGVEALNLYQHYMKSDTGYPDVILLDINMPVMNGFEFLEAFNLLNFRSKQNTVIIVMSSSRNQNDIARAQLLGVKHFLTKPLDESGLASILVN